MIKNYLLTALRKLARQRVITLINLIGLAIGMACCLVIYVIVKHEYTYDAFQENSDRIYRIVSETKEPAGVDYDGSICFPMAEALRDNFSALESAAQMYARNYGVIKLQDEKGGEKRFQAYHVAFTDAHFLKTFSFPLLAGHRPSLLQNPDEVVLTRQLADKIFGPDYQDQYDQLIGKMLEVNQQMYRVSGVLEDVPDNTNVYFHMLLPLETVKQEHPNWTSNWTSVPYASNAFLTLPEGYDPMQLEQSLNQLKHQYLDEDLATRRTYHLQALSDIHTEQRYGGTFITAPKPLMIALISMGIIVLLTGCINFINLSTAQAVQRAKEVGIRKALGSRKRQLIGQFLGEVSILCLIASLLAVGLADLFLGAANRYMSAFSNYIAMTFELDTTVIYFLVALIGVITIVAGYYPARVLASYRPVEALKQSIQATKVGFAAKFSLRKVLVVVQFTIAQFLLFGTVVVATQMRFFEEQDMGFVKDGVLVVDLPDGEKRAREQFRNELLTRSDIESVTLCSRAPTSRNKNFNEVYAAASGGAEKYQLEEKCIDPNYVSMFELTLVAGRNLREEDYAPDSVREYRVLLNEKAVKVLGFESPEEALGQRVMMGSTASYTMEVVGVLKDFANNTLKEAVNPNYLFYGDHMREANIKLASLDVPQTLKAIQTFWEEQYPDAFFQYEFLDDYIAILYTLEDTMFQFFRIMAGLAILIGCLGLYGLVSFLALHRRKEIGVRKTMGATVRHILYRFMKEFSWLVLLAFVIAAPLGYFAMRTWLDGFAHRIDLHAGYFILTFGAALLVAWLTVGFQSTRAALANPVDSLRNE